MVILDEFQQFENLHTHIHAHPLMNLSVFFFFEIWLVYSVVSISAVQQSDSVIHRHSFLMLFYIMVYHRILNIVPCAIQWELFAHILQKIVYICKSQLPVLPSPLPFPLVTTSLFYMSVSLELAQF